MSVKLCSGTGDHIKREAAFLMMDGQADGRGDHNELLRGRPWGGIVMYQFHLISTRLVTSATNPLV